MLAKSLTKQDKPTFRWSMALLLPIWVVVGFGLAQIILAIVLYGLKALGVPFAAVNESVFNTVVGASVYLLSMLLVVGVPWWAKKRSTTRSDIGLTRLPSWLDIGMAPAGFVVYLILSVILVSIATAIVPSIDMNQVQDTGFKSIYYGYEYILAFTMLIIVAPVAEEVLFRGYLYGKLRKSVPVWAAIGIVSVLFGSIHGQWNVAIDVFALSIVLCVLREITGSIWAGILLHMVKNGLAFYILFINPAVLGTIGG
ncbi:MAG: CPBP family intramembrane metalloprotease [Candidatus Saccharibacteria bacterium]|nr:MAG: CPBP family intramembrane metalloprotease [Candidatus Saccharibacteria bacterium]